MLRVCAFILFSVMLHVWWAASLSWVSTETMGILMEWSLLITSISTGFIDNLGSTSWISWRANALKQDILVQHLCLGSFIWWYHSSTSNWIMMAVNDHFSNTGHLWFLKLIVCTNRVLLRLTQMIVSILVMLSSKTTKAWYLMQVLASSVLSLSFLLRWGLTNTFIWLDRSDAHWND